MSRNAMRLLLAAVALAASVAHGQLARPLLGKTVQSVLDELRTAGAPLVYSTALVPSTLTIGAEPTATEPQALAREILAPHGLTVRPEGGAWLVVRADAAQSNPGAIVVEAQAAYAGGPVASFRVSVAGPATMSVEGANGRAELPRLAPGRYSVAVQATGFLPQRVNATVEAGA